MSRMRVRGLLEPIRRIGSFFNSPIRKTKPKPPYDLDAKIYSLSCELLQMLQDASYKNGTTQNGAPQNGQLVRITNTHERQVAFFVRQLLRSLKKLHDKGVAHLDIRPENITISELSKDRIILLDHGSAKNVRRPRPLSRTEIGAPEFVAPEIVLGKPVTTAADMWSVGVAAFVLLTGVSPFLGDCDTETLRNVAETRWNFSDNLNSVSTEGQDFICKLLKTEASDRCTVDSALAHRWISSAHDPTRPILNPDLLKEFSYRHQWVERRVFVKNSPDDASPPPEPRGFVTLSIPLAAAETAAAVDVVATVSLPRLHVSSMADGPPGGEQLKQQPGKKREASTLSDAETPTKRAAEEYLDPAVYLCLGQHRSIEDELANRVLSDISEESSDASEGGTFAEMADGERTPTSTRPSSSICSFGAEAHEPEVSPERPTDLPLSVEIPDPSDVVRRLHNAQGPMSTSPVMMSQLSVRSNSPSVVHSPTRPKEIEITAVIRSGQNTPVGTPDVSEISDIHVRSPTAMRKERNPKDKNRDKEGASAGASRVPTDTGFESLMAEVERAKNDFNSRMQGLADLSNRLDYVTDQADIGKSASSARVADALTVPPRGTYMKSPSKIDLDDIDRQYEPFDPDWTSEYQNGPETYLLALRDASMAARLRDYRRMLFGDEPNLSEKGVINELSRDIAIRERRRYTDLVKNDKDLQQVEENLEAQLQKVLGKGGIPLRRIRGPDAPPAVFQPIAGSSQDHAPVFRTRLHDAVYVDDTPLVLECSVVAHPTPEVTWFRNDGPLEPDEVRIRTEFTPDGIARIRYDPIYATDAGILKCYAENSAGGSYCQARLQLGDFPDKPGRPDVELASDTEIFVTWEPPKYTGWLDIQAYKLEYRKISSGDWSCPWLCISGHVAEEAAVVRRLEPTGIYQFRLQCKNAFGWGEPSLTSRMIQVHPKGAPKLNVDQLRQSYNLCVLNLPHSMSHSLDHIPEDMLQEDEEEETPSESEVDLLTSHGKRAKGVRPLVQLQKEDPKQFFQLESELFRGRFCVIRNALDQKSETSSHVAAKIVLAALDQLPHAVREFENLRDVQHDNVVTLLGAFHKEDFVLLFTERLHEDLLTRFTKNDYYTEEHVAKTMKQTLAALQWIHFKRIAHLDLQPDNLMFTSARSWHVKLLDLGSSVRLNPTGETKPSVNYSPEYSAPETLLHNYVVPSSDVWGVGIIMYILLSGFHPFVTEEDPDERILYNITHGKVDINYIYSNASSESLRFVTWALKKHPGNRMTSEEGLHHRWLGLDDVMLRRRENIRFSANRLRIFGNQYLSKRMSERTGNNELLSVYGERRST